MFFYARNLSLHTRVSLSQDCNRINFNQMRVCDLWVHIMIVNLSSCMCEDERGFRDLLLMHKTCAGAEEIFTVTFFMTSERFYLNISWCRNVQMKYIVSCDQITFLKKACIRKNKSISFTLNWKVFVGYIWVKQTFQFWFSVTFYSLSDFSLECTSSMHYYLNNLFV